MAKPRTSDIIDAPNRSGTTRRRAGELTQQQIGATIAVAATSTWVAAAAACGASERTLREWYKHHAEFRAAVMALRTEATQEALGKLQGASILAVEVLCEIAEAKGNEPRDRLRAADLILQYTLKQAADAMLGGSEPIEGVDIVRRPVDVALAPEVPVASAD